MIKEKAQMALMNAMHITKQHWNEFEGGFPSPASEHNFYKKIENNDWTAGFYTGLLWLFYEYSNDEFFKNLAEKQIASFRNRIEERVVVDHHDMGFIYSLSCVAAYKLTGNIFAKETALLAADNLRSRYHEKGNFIQAWGLLDDSTNYRLIIDCLLNLPLLYWASEVTGDESYAICAKKHLETTRKVMIRNDFSTYHTYYFNRETGKPDHGATKQGYSDESAWSRGQAWGVYGLMLNYVKTKDPQIIPQWIGVTDYFIKHLPDDFVAYWDFYFREGEEPRDSSASAIAICGILEAARQRVCTDDQLEIAYKMLDSLIDNYAALPEEEGSGILKHSTYGRLLGEGIDEFCLWGDYFYVEALIRILVPDWKMYW
ncbi:MAG: glycoside hydrolase family 88 protein [Lachnospiraceae bacterium]